MSFQEIAKLISEVAPTLSAVISAGNPAAGAVISLIGHVIGIESGKPEDIAKALQSPDALLKLKILEVQHQDSMTATAQQDLASARSLAQSATGNMRYWWAFLTLLNALMIVLTVGGLAYWQHGDIAHVLTVLLTMLIYGFGKSLKFWWGS